MKSIRTDVAVIGAGQAGLAASYFLRRTGIGHIVLERGRIGESWRSQRWDSFHLNTPNWCNSLPGVQFHPEDRYAFSHRDGLVSFFEEYVSRFDLPVETRSEVRGLDAAGPHDFRVELADKVIETRAVIIASGSMSSASLPAVSKDLPDGVLSLHTGEFRNAGELPEGAVLVVGSGQSGCQIAEDLLSNGREVYLCASKVGRVPRRYRGRDILDWWNEMGLLDVSVDDLEDPSIKFAAQPQVTGNDGGHSISLQSLGRDGAVLLGRLLGFRGGQAMIGDDLLDSVSFADGKAESFKAAIDKYVDANSIEAEEPEADPYEVPLPDLRGSDKLREIDLAERGIGTVIWCTGFGADWSWINIDVFEADGRPQHSQGKGAIPGLYFIGFPWLSKRKSGIIAGVAEDAERIVEDLKTGFDAGTGMSRATGDFTGYAAPTS